MPRLRPSCPALLPTALILLLASPCPAQPVRSIDLAQVDTAEGELRRVHGWTGSGVLGVAVAGGQDCDGDGRADYAMASLLASPLGRTRAGEVYLVFGDGTTSGTIDTGVVQPEVLRILGSSELETAGSELWIDDVTGDGIGDLLIARQNYRPDDQRPGAGALTIVAGGPALRMLAESLEPLDLAAVGPELAMTTFTGAAALDRLGIWMRTGDVSGDGIHDIVVGADQDSAGGSHHGGATYVIRGGAALTNAGRIDLASFGSTALAGDIARIEPPAPASEFHMGATCQVADLDGNGRAEVLTAAALNRAGASVAPAGTDPSDTHGAGGAVNGELYIVWDDNFPSGPWPAAYTFTIDQAPGTVSILRGATPNVSFGEEILGGLDYDNDGTPDLFVGDIVGDFSRERIGSGSGHLLYNAATLGGREIELGALPVDLRMTTFLGAAARDIAADTALHGDFDGDGIDDLAFSSPQADPLARSNAGAVHIFLGKAGGFPALIDLASPPPSAEVALVEIVGASGRAGEDRGDTLAYSAAAGDVDGDGRIDLITNEMKGNGIAPTALDVGNLVVVSGDLVAGNDDPPACSPQPLPDCETATSGRTRLRIIDRTARVRDRFHWRRPGGTATGIDFGNALDSETTGYRVCLYDAGSDNAALTDAYIPAGGRCGGRNCWRADADGFIYRDRTGRRSGITSLRLGRTADDKSMLRLKAIGSQFTTPGPPLHLPAILQFIVEDGVRTDCLQSVFTTAAVNEDGRMRAEAP